MVVWWVIKNKRHSQLVLKAQRVRQKRVADVKEFVRQHENLILDDNVKSKIMECNSIAELQKGLENGVFTSVDLLMFYIERWFTYGLKLNLITDPFFEEALQIARDCDETRKDHVKMEDIRQNTESKGLLFGIPLSLKNVVLRKEADQLCINLVDCIYDKESALESLIKKMVALFLQKQIFQWYFYLSKVTIGYMEKWWIHTTTIESQKDHLVDEQHLLLEMGLHLELVEILEEV